MTTKLVEIFSDEELKDIIAAADERGVFPGQLVHDAVMEDLYK